MQAGKFIDVKYIQPHYGRLVLIAIALVLSSIALLSFPWFLGRLIELGFDESQSHRLAISQLVSGWIGVMAFQSVASFYAIYQSGKVTQQIIFDFREAVYSNSINSALKQWNEHARGERLSRLTADTNVLGYFLGNNLPLVLLQLITALGAYLVILKTSPVLSLVILFAAFPTIVISVLLRRLTRRRAAKMLQTQGELFAHAEENFLTYLITKATATESYSIANFSELNKSLRNQSLSYIALQSSITPIVRFFSLLILVIGSILVFGSALKANLKPSDWSYLLLYGLLVVRPFAALAGIFAKYQQAFAAYERIMRLLDTNSSDHKEPRLTPVIKQTPQTNDSDLVLRVDDLSFSYGRGERLLENISFNLKQGDILLLTGENGSGKSTLAYLLLDLLAPAKGEISISGASSMRSQDKSWRSNFGYVAQQPMLRQGPIKDNLLLGRNCSADDLRKALFQSGAQTFIDDLPEGLDTQLVTGGAGLSGGQQQKLSFARAVMTHPGFLILDEPTSMLDSDGVNWFIERSPEWSKDKGVIIISHESSLSSIATSKKKLHNYQLLDI